LLCLGRHPFAGNGDLTLQDAIKQNLHTLADSDSARAFKVTGLTPDDILSPSLIRMMRRSFAPGWLLGRPSARDWASALSSYHGSLKSCRVNQTHAYPRHRSSCPWCQLEKAGRPSFFYPTDLVSAAPAQRPWWQRSANPKPARVRAPTAHRTTATTVKPLAKTVTAGAKKRTDNDFWAFLFIGAAWYVGYPVFFAKKTTRWEPPSYEEPAPEPPKKKHPPKSKAPPIEKKSKRAVTTPVNEAYPYGRTKLRAADTVKPERRAEPRGIPWEPRRTTSARPQPLPWGNPPIRYFDQPRGFAR
jgi:hypothetical protein